VLTVQRCSWQDGQSSSLSNWSGFLDMAAVVVAVILRLIIPTDWNASSWSLQPVLWPFPSHVHYRYCKTLEYFKLHALRKRAHCLHALFLFQVYLGFKYYSFFSEAVGLRDLLGISEIFLCSISAFCLKIFILLEAHQLLMSALTLMYWKQKLFLSVTFKITAVVFQFVRYSIQFRVMCFLLTCFFSQLWLVSLEKL
jgi:hypothetical protein